MAYGVIVDGYSSGADLVYEFNRMGITCIHVQSASKIPDVYSKTFHPKAYAGNFIFDGSFFDLIEKIKPFKPIFAITGSEPGVELADQIANALQLATANPLQTSPHRRNKFLMMKQIRAAGLNYLKEYKASSLQEILEKADSFKKWPLVIKPLKSAGGDKVKICYSEEDITAGFNEIVSDAPNMLGLIDQEVLIQEYIDAPEYAINTVQFEGRSYLCEVWRFHKLLLPDGKKIYDYAELLASDAYDPALVTYAFQVAEALDINFGPMHAEIFLTPNGPVLIEAAARVMGANVPLSLMRASLNTSQAFMSVLAYANPHSFLKAIKSNCSINKHIIVLFLISSVTGKYDRLRGLEKIKSLPSFCGIKIRLNDFLYITKDYDTSPGLIYLAHEDKDILKKDYLTIRELEPQMYEGALGAKQP